MRRRCILLWRKFHPEYQLHQILLNNSCYAKSVFNLPRPSGRGLKRPESCGLQSPPKQYGLYPGFGCVFLATTYHKVIPSEKVVAIHKSYYVTRIINYSLDYNLHGELTVLLTAFLCSGNSIAINEASGTCNSPTRQVTTIP